MQLLLLVASCSESGVDGNRTLKRTSDCDFHFVRARA